MAVSEATRIEVPSSPLRGAGERGYEPGAHYVPLNEKERDGRVKAHAVQTVLAEPEALYRLWRDVSLIPRWQEYVVFVTPISDGLSHWVMGDPEDADGRRIEFDSQIVEEVPGSGFAWQSVTEGVEQSGAVTFTPSPSGRGTLVTLVQEEKIPGSSLTARFAAVAKRSPRQIVIEDLRHFKQLAETGEIPSVKGQPHGPRGLSGGVKEWFYGENNPTPPGTSDLS